MAKCKVTSSVAFIAGQKYRRGDIIEIADPNLFGASVEVIAEPVAEEKPKAPRKPRTTKA